jgi:hypothetical protein
MQPEVPCGIWSNFKQLDGCLPEKLHLGPMAWLEATPAEKSNPFRTRWRNAPQALFFEFING